MTSLYHGIGRCYSQCVTSALFALAMLASQSSQPLVLIPLHESEAECVVHERLAAVLDLVPDVRVLRAAKQKGEKLEAARVRLRADLALARDTANLAATGRSNKTQPLGIDFFAALAAVWPPGFPSLPTAHALGAANTDALMAACRNDSAAAYAASGPAIGPVLRARLDPPGSVNLRVLERWAQANAAVRRGDHKRAIPVLKLVVENLSKGIVGPVWRRPPASGAHPSSLSLIDDLLIAFEAGTFVALDPTSGEERWRTMLGTAEPDLIEADKVLLAILENKIVALDRRNGKSAWTIEIMSPHPEVVLHGGRIFAAGVEELIAVDPAKGEVIWRYDPLDDIAAGPSLVGTDLAIPASTFVHLVGSSDGKAKKKIDTKDEISSPLAVTPKGAVWALVGSDEVVQVDPVKGVVAKRVNRFPGADWPPAIGGEQVVIAARRGKKTLVAYFDPTAKAGLARLYYGASSPLIALPGAAGIVHPTENPFAVVARNLEGKPMWTAKLRAAVSSLSASDGLIAGSSGARAFMLDQKGQQIRMIELDGRITEVVLGQKGGAAILEKGTIYGLPAANDPRPTRWLEEARMDLARAHLAMKQRPAALALVRTVLTKNPNQLDALALRAEITEATPGAAVVDWLNLMARAPKGDAMVARASEAVARLGGIEMRLTLDRPIEDLAVAGDTILLLSEGTASARSVAEPMKVLWTKPAKAIGAALDGFEIDGTFFDRQGKAGQKRTKDHRLGADALFVLEASKAISRLDAAAKPKWRQTFDLPVDVLGADARYLLVGDNTEGVQLIDAVTGTRKWLLPIGARATGGWIGKDTLLVRTAKGFRGLALDDGKTRFDLKMDPGEGSLVLAASNGYLIGVGKKIILVDERGKQRPIVTAQKVAHASGSFVALEDGVLHAINLDKAQISGRLKIGPFKRMALAGNRLLGLRQDGSLLVIDAARGLRPR